MADGPVFGSVFLTSFGDSTGDLTVSDCSVDESPGLLLMASASARFSAMEECQPPVVLITALMTKVELVGGG